MNRKSLAASLGVLAVVVAACLGRATPATGQELDPKAQVESFFTLVKKGNIESAYQTIFAASGLVAAKPQALEALRRQTEAFLPLFGEIVGWELVSQETFGTSLVRMVYLLKAEKHALTWEFYFYKPKKTWFASQVTFDDQFRALGPKVSIGGRPSA
jgi:hypothetical protein